MTNRNNRLYALHDKVHEAEKYFSGSYPIEVKNVKRAYGKGDIEKVLEGLRKLPTKEDLLRSLFERLKGKSVYKTLNKILKEEKVEREIELKGLFSLGTHIVIECEKGNSQYEVLLPYVYERLGAVLFSR